MLAPVEENLDFEQICSILRLQFSYWLKWIGLFLILGDQDHMASESGEQSRSRPIHVWWLTFHMAPRQLTNKGCQECHVSTYEHTYHAVCSASILLVMPAVMQVTHQTDQTHIHTRQDKPVPEGPGGRWSLSPAPNTQESSRSLSGHFLTLLFSSHLSLLCLPLSSPVLSLQPQVDATLLAFLPRPRCAHSHMHHPVGQAYTQSWGGHNTIGTGHRD